MEGRESAKRKREEAIEQLKADQEARHQRERELLDKQIAAMWSSDGSNPSHGGEPASDGEPSGSAPVRYLCEMTPEEVEAFVEGMVEKLTNRYDSLSMTVASLLGSSEAQQKRESLRRVCENDTYALANNTYGGPLGREIQKTFHMFVNGDPQRGKSAFEAFLALAVFYINQVGPAPPELDCPELRI